MIVRVKDQKYVNWYKRYSGKDYYTGDSYIEPNLKESIDTETGQYEDLNKISPVVVHKSGSESYVELFDGRIISYDEYKKNYLDQNGWLKKEIWQQLYYDAYGKDVLL